MPWIYESVAHQEIKKLKKCIYCRSSQLSNLPAIERDFEKGTSRYKSEMRMVSRCVVCGWWHLQQACEKGNGHYDFFEAFGQLKALDVSDISSPIDEVRSFLTARYEARFHVNPMLFEETVASVLRDMGYEARVTAQSGDWGIDIFLDGPNNSLIGVQVKRWENAINVEQITALTGALVINNCTKGVFVTTSKFRSGAKKVADKSSMQGFPIELVDAKKFYDILQIVQAKIEVQADDPQMPWNRIDPRKYTYTW